MLAKLRTKAQEDEGFTLIELLVVIIIIGILAAIAIPVFLNQRKKAEQASIKSDLRTLANAMETYYVDNQSYPNIAKTSGAVPIGTQSVTLSKGNWVGNMSTTATGVAAGTFCISVSRDSTGTDALWYDSDKGGIQPKGTECT